MTDTTRPEAPERIWTCANLWTIDRGKDSGTEYIRADLADVLRPAASEGEGKSVCNISDDDWQKAVDCAARQFEGHYRNNRLGTPEERRGAIHDIVSHAIGILQMRELSAASKSPQYPSLALAGGWHEGAPPKPWCEEWFIAETTFNDRVVLKALPEEFAYDFKTADEIYIKKDKLRRWMQLPDSGYIPFAADSVLAEENRVLAEENRVLREALKPFVKFLTALVANDGALDMEMGYIVLDEINDTFLRLRDYRAARAALAITKAEICK